MQVGEWIRCVVVDLLRSQWLTCGSIMSGSTFCLKICDPAGLNPAGFCHTIALDGCAYNAPSKYSVAPIAGPGTFETCDSDDMEIPGVFVSSVITMSHSQPADSIVITTLPYPSTIPASSNCVPTASSVLYTDLASVSISASGSATRNAGASATSASSGSSSRSGTAATTGASTSQTASGAMSVGVSVTAAILGVVFSVVVVQGLC
jgi:hypothetical protein